MAQIYWKLPFCPVTTDVSEHIFNFNARKKSFQDFSSCRSVAEDFSALTVLSPTSGGPNPSSCTFERFSQLKTFLSAKNLESALHALRRDSIAAVPRVLDWKKSVSQLHSAAGLTGAEKWEHSYPLPALFPC